MSSLLDAPALGSQTPRILVAPPSSGSQGWDLIELCEGVGMSLDEGQKLTLVEICAESRPGKWAAMETLDEEPRQNGKGLDIEGLQLGDLFLFDSSLVSTYSAHEFSTARKQFERLRFWIENNDDLRKRCKKPTVANGNVGIQTLAGHQVWFRARTNDGGRGLTGDRIILDEAFDLPGPVIGSLVPSLSAVPNAQINYFSSAGFGVDEAKSDVLWDIRKQAIVAALKHLGRPIEEPEGEFHVRGVPGAHVYLNWSASPSAITDVDNEAHWATANRALGTRMSHEFVRTVERRRMVTVEQFAQERLGIWPPSRRLEDEDEGESLRDLWAQCELAVSTVGKRRAFGVGVAPESTSAALWVAGESSAGGWHLEIIDHGPDVQAIGARAKALAVKHKAKVGFDPSGPAGVLVPVLGDVGLKVSGAQLAAACADLVAGVKAKTIRQRVPSKLATAVAASMAGAVKDPKPGDGGWVWSCKSSAVDITPTTGATVALWAAKASPARKSTRSY